MELKTDADLQHGLDMNLWAGFWAMQAAFPHMRSQQWGRVINIGADSVRNGLFEDSIYSVDDFIAGPYSGECTGKRTLYCRCNNGAR